MPPLPLAVAAGVTVGYTMLVKNRAKRMAAAERLLVTDGVQGRRDRVGGFHPFNSALCKDLKTKIITVMFLNTKYIPIPTMAPHQQTIQPVQNQLDLALQTFSVSVKNFTRPLISRTIDIYFGNIFIKMIASLPFTR